MQYNMSLTEMFFFAIVKKMNKILLTVALVFIVFIFVPQTNAVKTLPQSKSNSKTFTVTPKLRYDRQALIVYFGNLQNVRSVSYMLVYTTNGQEEGAGGSVNPSQGSTTSRELLFGTCSKNVCRYHPNITNMRFEVTAQLTSGKKLTKRYKIKI